MSLFSNNRSEQRDELAKIAFTHLITLPVDKVAPSDLLDWTNKIASESYRYADAMMNAKEKK